MTDATYWTERVEATRARPLKYFLCFGTGRARNFPLILVDVLPREVVHRLGLLPRHRKEFPLMAQHTIPCMATWMVIVRSRDLR